MSTREFTIVGFENLQPFKTVVTFEDLINKEDDTELIYTLWEDIDSILDLKAGQCIYIRTSRDGGENLGVIARTR